MNTSFFEKVRVISFIFIFVSVTSCKKSESNYILHKYEYSAGEMLEVENLSINNKEIKWEVISPQNEIIQTSSLKNPSLVLGIMNDDGNYILRLTSYSGSQKKGSVDEKPFLIKTMRTYLTVNQNGNGDHTDYRVYVDNQYVGKSSFNGSFQVKIPLGVRIVKLVAANDEKIQTMLFKENNWEYIYF